MSYPRFQRARDFKKVIGTGGGNHTFTSTTFADVAAAYTVTLKGQVGDELLLHFSCNFSHSGTNSIRIRFAVNGTALGTMPTTLGLYSEALTNSRYAVFEWVHTLTAGDLSSGFVTAKPQAATGAATLTITNNGTDGIPVFFVANLGPADPN